MKKVGIVASDSNDLEVMIIPFEEYKKDIHIDDVVQITDIYTGEKYLAIIRSGQGINANLDIASYSPSITYAIKGNIPSNSREVFVYKASIVGVVGEDGISVNRSIISPRSRVYLLEKNDEYIMKILSKTGAPSNLKYTGNIDWTVPIDPNYISYHIGVFGTTGSGKSYLTRHVLIPFLREAGYKILILDWKGSDYAPYYDTVVGFKDIMLDDKTVYTYLIKTLDNFGDTREGQLQSMLEDVIYRERWRTKKNGERRSGEEVKKYIMEKLEERVRMTYQTRDGDLNYTGKNYISKIRRYFAKIDDEKLDVIMGDKTPEDILRLLDEHGIVVIDMSIGSKENKLSVFLSISYKLKEMMEHGKKLNIALVIDEAPQYAPFNPSGVAYETTELIKDLAAIGREYRLALILLAQGIAGEIGLNAAVRRNLNTLFFGKLHPRDIHEAGEYLRPFGLEPRRLLSLRPGHFYFLGHMNPLGMPILTTFDIPDTKKQYTDVAMAKVKTDVLAEGGK